MFFGNFTEGQKIISKTIGQDFAENVWECRLIQGARSPVLKTDQEEQNKEQKRFSGNWNRTRTRKTKTRTRARTFTRPGHSCCTLQ